ncbi:MAG: hypothetical protein WD875_15350 [Pirellulales bacterium]
MPNDPPPGNPFATRHVRPGAIPYFFADGESAEALVARLAENGWQGEIVGPHGSGKSTLLAVLLPEIERAGRAAVTFRLREGDRRLPRGPVRVERLPAGTVVVVDGYEQLRWWRKLWLRWTCRRRSLGLLVTTHTAAGLPDLYRTCVDQPTAERVVEHLLASESAAAAMVSREDVARAIAAHPTNLREALFALYDVCERRRRG